MSPLLTFSIVYFLTHAKLLWIGLCVGIPICVALLMKDDWDD